jgi:hypothetical protein
VTGLLVRAVHLAGQSRSAVAVATQIQVAVTYDVWLKMFHVLVFQSLPVRLVDV